MIFLEVEYEEGDVPSKSIIEPAMLSSVKREGKHGLHVVLAYLTPSRRVYLEGVILTFYECRAYFMA